MVQLVKRRVRDRKNVDFRFDFQTNNASLRKTLHVCFPSIKAKRFIYCDGPAWQKTCKPSMLVRYGTFRICILPTSHLLPYRTSVPYLTSIFEAYPTYVPYLVGTVRFLCTVLSQSIWLKNDPTITYSTNIDVFFVYICFVLYRKITL